MKVRPHGNLCKRSLTVNYLYSSLSLQERIYNASLHLQANTYPLVGRASIRDVTSGASFNVITRRPIGISSYNNSLDFSLHRLAHSS